MNNWMYGSRYNLEPIYYMLLCLMIPSIVVGFKLGISEGIYLIPICMINTIYRILHYEYIHKPMVYVTVVYTIANVIINSYYVCGIYVIIGIYVFYSYTKMKEYCILLEGVR